jgi:spermidine/putrescine transport system ATP-binding protein
VRDTSSPTGHAPAIITLDHVEKYYGEYHALRDISAEIRQGEFFSLLGPSGCGKTTLLRAIAGFEDISSGTIRLDGKDMEGVAPNKRPTNLVFQSYAIFPHLSVSQNVGFGLRKSQMSAEEKRRAVGEALEMVGLQDFGGARGPCAVGRAAAARGAGARADPQAARAPARRAAVRARQEDARGHAGGADQAPARGGDHLHPRDP